MWRRVSGARVRVSIRVRGTGVTYRHELLTLTLKPGSNPNCNLNLGFRVRASDSCLTATLKSYHHTVHTESFVNLHFIRNFADFGHRYVYHYVNDVTTRSNAKKQPN